MASLAESRARGKGQSNGTDKAQALRQRSDASIETLAKAFDDARASDVFRQYLATQAKFHKYSWGNCLLLASQRPQATRVAGYRTWQGLKRQVRKGELGIMIFAPCPYKREVETSNGSTEEREGMFFRAVHVFDVAQTDGPELPSVDVQAAVDDLLAKLPRVADSCGIAVSFQPISGDAFGVSKQGKVDIDNSHPTGQQAKTLAHELAREAMHWEDRGPLTRSSAELEAEPVAYVVCLHFSLDVEVRARRYIALWDGDSKALRASLDCIAKTARGMIDDLDAAAGRKAVA